MVEDRLSDGTRIAQLFASEIEGHGDSLDDARVVEADPDVTPTDDGAFAYAVAVDGARVAEVYVQPTRARVEFLTGQADVAEAASEAGLRVRPKAVDPPRTLVFLEDGTGPKRVLDALEAAVTARA